MTARMRASSRNAFHFGIDDQQDEVNVMRVERALQTFQGGRSFVQPDVQESQRIWRHVFVTRNSFQRMQQVLGFARAGGENAVTDELLRIYC